MLQHQHARLWMRCKRAWAGAWDRSRWRITHRLAPLASTQADSCHHRRALDLMTLLQWRTAILGSEHALDDDDMLRIAPDAAPAATAWYRSELARYTEGLPHELYQREVTGSLYIKCRVTEARGCSHVIPHHLLE